MPVALARLKKLRTGSPGVYLGADDKNPTDPRIQPEPSPVFVPSFNFPLCGDGNTTQLRGNASPSTRPLMLARKLGAQALVGSVCALDEAGSYGSFLEALGEEVSKRLR